jgi:hypothetical protein
MGKCFVGKELWWIGHACETKPIPGGAAGKNVQNEPNLAASCAKRTQFPAPPGGTGLQGRATRGESCQTNPISATPRGTGILPVAQNHGQDADPKRELSRLGTRAPATGTPDGIATSLSETWDHSCKTNPIPGEAGRDEATGAWDGGKSCKTNPISGPAGWPRLGGQGVNMQNKPNFAERIDRKRGRPC